MSGANQLGLRPLIIADGVVHAIGVCLGLIGVTIVMIAVNIERIEIAPITSAW
jgi:hypothetical protein